MPYSVVDKPSSYFNTLLYTGNGSTLTVTGNNFQPDFTWIKERSAAGNHKLADVVRGTTKYLSSNLTDAEDSTGSGIQSWNSTGFSLSNATDINDSGQTYVSWNWLGANTTVSNTAGTISSTVSANTTSGFSIVSYTGNLTNGATVGHGLGVAPAMMIVKRRNNADSWVVYHRAMSSNGDFYLYLNTTDAKSNLYNQFYDTSPTSSVFYLSNSNTTNASGDTYIAYCFAEVKGFSKFGSYTGNGNADGTFVYTGFKPAMVIIKSSNAAYNWYIFDNKRSGYNVDNDSLSPDLSNSEYDGATYNFIDLLSNGFKMRETYAGRNASGGTYIYMAFADSPFCSSKGIPTTAR
jgi:hypothetical protein